MSTESAGRRPLRVRRIAAALAVPLALVALTSCGDDAPADDPTTESGSAAAGDDLTAPGTELELGDTAIVPRTDGTGVLELTVTGIAEGDPADLEATGLEDWAEQTPYYVSYEMRLISGESDGIVIRDYLSAWADDAQVGDLVAFDGFAPCQEQGFPVGASPGTIVSSCRTYLVDAGGAPVDTVRFDNDDAYENGEGTQVVWREG